MSAHLTERDWELLSTYLDEQLTQNEKNQFEERLKKQEDLQIALESLRKTHIIMRNLPRKRLPRNFTLTPVMVESQKRKFPLMLPIFSLGSALAMVLLVVSLVLGPVSLSRETAGNPAPAAAQPKVALMVESTKENQTPEAGTSPPPIIIWGPPAAQGRGGGGGSEPPQMLAVPNLASQATPAAALPSGPQKPDQTRQATESTPLEGSGPILGVSSDATNKLPSEVPVPMPESLHPQNSTIVTSFPIIQVILVIIAFTCGLAAIILWWKNRS